MSREEFEADNRSVRARIGWWPSILSTCHHSAAKWTRPTSARPRYSLPLTLPRLRAPRCSPWDRSRSRWSQRPRGCFARPRWISGPPERSPFRRPRAVQLPGTTERRRRRRSSALRASRVGLSSLKIPPFLADPRVTPQLLIGWSRSPVAISLGGRRKTPTSPSISTALSHLPRVSRRANPCTRPTAVAPPSGPRTSLFYRYESQPPIGVPPSLSPARQARSASSPTTERPRAATS